MLKKALLKIDKLLKKSDTKGFKGESVMILSAVAEKPIEYIYTYPEVEISLKKWQKAEKMAEKRVNGMPMAYVLGKKEFFGLDFNVNTNVLIPRPETEMLVEEAIRWARNYKKDERLLIVDIGTGSGCISIAVAKNIENESIEFIATDFSEDALKIAKENIELHALSDKIKLKKSDLLKDIDVNIFNQKNILIIANLPYLSEKIYDGCCSSVKDFEPKEALFSGKDGLDHYRRLFDEIKLVIDKLVCLRQIWHSQIISNLDCSGQEPLNPQKMTNAKSLEILLEISPEQKELIEELIKEKFGNINLSPYYKERRREVIKGKNKFNISIKKDLAGKWRMVRIEL